ncbi:hypothetical protein GOODEAATRI_010404 [Goodea atripinnis]|uniref:Uncharacterized protein n=1 Tax=Goodea atripinnis TaxID=208336 RepID=A0ABV0PMF6_9TELE
MVFSFSFFVEWLCTTFSYALERNMKKFHLPNLGLFLWMAAMKRGKIVVIVLGSSSRGLTRVPSMQEPPLCKAVFVSQPSEHSLVLFDSLPDGNHVSGLNCWPLANWH